MQKGYKHLFTFVKSEFFTVKEPLYWLYQWEVSNYHPPKLGGCQEPNADGQFTRPFGAGAYNL